MAETTFTIDVSQAFAALDGLERRLAELEASSKRARESTKKVFTPGGELARRELAALDQAQKEYLELANASNRLRAAKEKAFDPRAIETYTKAINEAEEEMRKLERAANATGVDLKKALEPPKSQGFGDQIFGNLKSAALGAAAGLSFGAAIKEGIELNAAYERVRTSLAVILKDADKADKLLAKLGDFAAETPFDSDQINDAAKALLAFGVSEDEVIPRLKEIGTLSAATGKDFNELTSIYGKARNAGVLYADDINQLIDAGIPIVQEFAKQMGVSEAQVKKLASEGRIGFNQLQAAFTNLTSEGGKFDGLLEKQAQTLTGVGSRLKELFSVRLQDFFAPIADSLKRGGLALISILEPTKAATSAFNAQASKVAELEKTLPPLLTRYEQLKAKTNPTAKEQKELGEVIQQIGRLTPGAITEIDKYGNALSINAGKSREFLEAEKARLKFVNAEAIKTVQAAKETAEQEAKILQDRIKAGKQVVTTTGAGGGGAFGAGSTSVQAREVNLTATEIEEITKKVSKLTETAKGAEAELKRLKGEPLPGESEKPSTPGTIPPLAPSKDSKKKAKTAAEIAFENREKDLQLRQLLLNDLEDGLEKELEVIRLHFDQLRLEYDKAKADTSKLDDLQNKAEISAVSEFLFKQVEADAAALESVKASGQAYIKTKQDEFEQQKTVRDAEINLAQERGNQLVAIAIKSGAKEREVADLQRAFDLATQKARLESEILFQEQLLTIVGDGNQQQADQIKQTIEQLKAEVGTIDIKIATPQSSGKKQSVWDFLGIDMESDAGKEFAGQVQEMASSVIASLQEMAATRVALAEEEVERSDERLSKLESELQTEIDLQQLGFAANVSLKRKQIEEEKKKNAAAKAEAEKARKSQVAIDTAIQASSLITTIANLFKSLSSLPFGAGVPIAIALSAAMIGFFIKSKVDAAKAAKARYGASGFIDDQGIVKGKYHTQGGQQLEVERGEMVQVGDDGKRKRLEVVRRERVTEYMDLLRAANDGDRKELALQALKLADIRTLPADVRAQIIQSAGIEAMPPDVRAQLLLNADIRTLPADVRAQIIQSAGIEAMPPDVRAQLLLNADIRTLPADVRAQLLLDSDIRTMPHKDRAQIIQSAGIEAMPPQTQAHLIHRAGERLPIGIQIQLLQSAAIGAMPPQVLSQIIQGASVTKTFTRGPEIRRRKVTSLVFGKDKTPVSVRVEGDDSRRTNELLEAVLKEVVRQGKTEKWSPDGRTKTKGGIKTTYIG